MIIERIERLLRARFEYPKEYSKNHIILASFPKSGNTWLRFVSSNIIAQQNVNVNVNFDTIERLAPNIRGNRNLKGIISSNDYPNFLKTHFYFVNGFKQYPALVLYRNPVSTFQSFFNYMKIEQKKDYKDFEKFITSPRVGINAWNYFYSTWLSHKHSVFISYDELIKNQFDGINKIYKTFGYDISKDFVNKSIELSSRENMSKIEKELGDPFKKSEEYKFVGTKESRYTELDEKLVGYINDKTYSVRRELDNKRLQFLKSDLGK
jgi:hypothetical protein